MRTQLACTLALVASTAGSLATVPYRPPIGAEFEHIPLVFPSPLPSDVVGPANGFVVRWPRVAVHAGAVVEFDMHSRTSERIYGRAATYDYPPTQSVQTGDMLVEPLAYVGEEIAFLTAFNRVVLISRDRAYSPFLPTENYVIPRRTGTHDADASAIFGVASRPPGGAPLGVIRKAVGQPATVVVPPTGTPRNATFVYSGVIDVRASGQGIVFRASAGNPSERKLMYMKGNQIVDVGSLITQRTGYAF
ncbi:MAG: hypothetical protein K2X32_05815, partial [Phycisphaerales bacterium]|nr:hypothetical protein [Phycisphaerales bacterium]